jgi:hypothetical protein
VPFSAFKDDLRRSEPGAFSAAGGGVLLEDLHDRPGDLGFVDLLVVTSDVF